MKQFKNILVVYETDDATLRRAALLAKNNQAELTLIQVIEGGRGSQRDLKIGKQSVRVSELLLNEARMRLRAVADSMTQYGVRPSSVVCMGDPTHEIVCQVLDKSFDLVIMSADLTLGLRQQLFGTTALRMMRKCPVPVLVTRPEHGSGFKTIVAAIDPTDGPAMVNSLDLSILRLSQDLARMENAELHVVNAWSVMGESILRSQSEQDGKDVDRWVETELKATQLMLGELLRRNQISEAILHVQKGDAAAVITKLIATLNADLLVMGTVCRTGIPGFVIGNTAERVLGSVQCSVLVIKPEGFVSPIVPRKMS